MGSDNLHHKRKAKAERELKRRKSRRDSYEKILTVCEGEKTEPNYFNELVNYYKLNSANVEIDGTCGSSPKSVLERAEKLTKLELDKGDGYDRVYCVFDKDSHQTYDETIKRISLKKPSKLFYLGVSIPCFEYWLLLHFKYSTKPYQAAGNSSIANEVLRELKTVFPAYTKGCESTFITLIDQIEFAKQNAIRAAKSAKENYTDNPSTHIHELVEYLQNLKAV